MIKKKIPAPASVCVFYNFVSEFVGFIVTGQDLSPTLLVWMFSICLLKYMENDRFKREKHLLNCMHYAWIQMLTKYTIGNSTKNDEKNTNWVICTQAFARVCVYSSCFWICSSIVTGQDLHHTLLSTL